MFNTWRGSFNHQLIFSFPTLLSLPIIYKLLLVSLIQKTPELQRLSRCLTWLVSMLSKGFSSPGKGFCHQTLSLSSWSYRPVHVVELTSLSFFKNEQNWWFGHSLGLCYLSDGLVLFSSLMLASFLHLHWCLFGRHIDSSSWTAAKCQLQIFYLLH